MPMTCRSGKFPLEEGDKETDRLFLIFFNVLILPLLGLQASMEWCYTFRMLPFEISENSTVFMISFWFA